MVKVFNNRQRTVSQIVEETLDVSANGDVTFRAGLGKGSGRPIEIPANEFDSFVTLINETAATREDKAREAANTETSVEPTTTEDDTNPE